MPAEPTAERTCQRQKAETKSYCDLKQNKEIRQHLIRRSWAKSPQDDSETLLSCKTSLWVRDQFPQGE